MEITRQKTYRRTFDLAREQLARLPLEEQAAKAGLSCRAEERGLRITVPTFDEIIEVEVPGFSFLSSKAANITLTTKIILLHYIVHASGLPLSGDLLPYEDVPGCRGYAPVFDRRVTRPLLSGFGYDRDAFLQAGMSLGGRQEEYGNASFTVNAFPRVPISFILWEGDDDFPPSLKVLFDRTVHTYLPLEDIVVVSKMAATRILKHARKDSVE